MQTMQNQSHQQSSMGPRFQVQWKNDRVVTIDPDAPLWEAIQLMRKHQIGDVLVVDPSSGRGEPLGVITDRDIALCMSENVDFKSLRVMDIMSTSVVTASTSDDLFQIIRTMKDNGVTRLPLMDRDGRIAGVLTAKNILEILVGCFFDMTQISERQQENEQMSQH